ncbi:MAG: hypothetical protein V1495_11470 [Pseudomonadota bacterium]
MKKRNLWSGIAVSALLLAPVASWAASDDQVVQATTEDVKAFENAVMEKNQARDQVRERDRLQEHQATGSAVQEKARIRTEKAARTKTGLGEVVSEEAKKLKNADPATRNKFGEQVRERARQREETQEQAQTRQRQGWDAVRDTTVQSGQRNGVDAGAGSGSATSGSGSGQQNGTQQHK